MRLTRTLLSGVAAMALLAGPALAQPAPGQYQHNDTHGQMSLGGQEHGPQQYQQDHGPQQYQQDHGPQQYHDSQRGPMGPSNMDHQDNHGGDAVWGHDNHRWSRGEHYDGQRYVVHHDDWDRYHLHAPPPGYEWVRSGDQFVMIAIASGIIASIITGSVYGN